MTRKISLTLGFILLSSSIVFAQRDTLLLDLKEVNIIAAKVEKSSAKTPRSVTVLTAADLERTPYLTLGNLLEEQAGIYLVGGGQVPGSNQSIFMRGANSNQTAIFLDGVRIQDVSTVNGVVDLSELPIGDVDRIEILRGAEGTLYGSPAVGGVIRISTKGKSKSAGIHGNVAARGGLFREGGQDAGTAFNMGFTATNGWYLQSSLDIFRASGFNATLDTGFRLPGIEPDDDDWTKFSGAIKAGYSSAATDFQVGYRKLISNTAIDRSAYQDDDNYTLDFTRNLGFIQLERKFSPAFSMNFSGNWTTTSRSSVNDSSLVPATGISDRTSIKEEYTGQQVAAELSARYSGKKYLITAGCSGLLEKMTQETEVYSALYAPFIYESFTSLDTLDPKATTTAYYIHGDLNGGLITSYLKDFNLMAGFRFTHHSIVGNNSTFEFSPSFQVADNTMLYISYSTGFTNPSLYQLYAPETYLPYDGQPSSGLTRGNKSLLPELSRSFEVGVKDRSTEGYDWTLSIFRSISEQLIDYVYLWDGTVAIDQLGSDFNRDDYRGDRYMNVGTMVAQGAEFTLNKELTQTLSLSVTASLVDGYMEFQSTTLDTALQVQAFSTGTFLQDDVRYEGLVRRPSTFRARMSYVPHASLVLGIQYSYAGRRGDVYYDSQLGPYGGLNTQSVGAYALVDMDAHWSINDHLAASLQLENLFDVKYQEILGFRTRGRGVQLRVSYSF